MHSYVASLIDSGLPIEPWLVGIAWLLLLAGTQAISRQSRLLLRTQEHVVVEESALLARSHTRRYLVAQIGSSALLFALCYYVGEPLFTFVAGGFVAALAMAFGLNLHSLAFARHLHDDDTVTGKVTLSATFALGDMGRRALTCAVVYLVLGVVFAQLALLGGALILTSMGVGYVRRSREPRAHP